MADDEFENPPGLLLDKITRNSEVVNRDGTDYGDDGYNSDGGLSSPALSYDGLHYTPPTSPRWKKSLPFKIPNLMPHGGILSSAVNMAQAALGAGTLGFAAALKECGIGIGIFFTLLFCGATIFSVRMLCHCMEQTHKTTYEELCAKLIHPRAKHAISGIIVTFYWGTTILYVIAIGQMLHPLTDSDSFPDWMRGEYGGKAVTTIFWVLVMFPLSLLKEMNSLRFSSALGLITIFILMVSIMYHAESDGIDWANATWAKFDVGMVVALPTICFSYSCQALCFSIYHEMHPRTPARMTKATAGGMVVSTVVYLCCGIWGYLNFGEDTKGDILQNYKNPDKTGYLMAAFIGMGATITFSFPVCIVPTRDSILQVMGYRDVYSTPPIKRIAVAGFLSLTSLVIGLFITNISIVFNLLGGICGSCVCFIFPSWLALKSKNWDVEHIGYFQYGLTWVLLGTGLCTCVLGTAVGLWQNLG